MKGSLSSNYLDSQRAPLKKWASLSSLILLIFFTSDIIGKDKWLAPHRSKDPKLDTVQFPYFPSRIQVDFGGNHKRVHYDSPEVCRACHTEIFEQWEQSAMAHAWEDPIYKAMLKRASEATNGAIDNFCIGCHSPIGLVTKEAAATKDGAEIPGVDCETCHSVSTATGLDNGAFIISHHRKDGRIVKYGPRSDAKSEYHLTYYSELHSRSSFCAVCHNVTHPFNGAAIERTYDEWLDSAYSEAGIECQDCHMTPGPGVTQNPGKAALTGKQRENVASHFFAGANVPLMRHLGKHEMAERNIAMLRSAAAIEVLNPKNPVAPGSMVTVMYKVSNVGAGHKLPTGFPEGREMWVDFRVVGQAGKVFYRSGNIENGKTAPGTKSFKVVMGDKNGDVVDMNVWEVTHVISDTRIMPKGYSIIEFNFLLPEDAPSELTLQADLRYWPFPQSMVDELLGEDSFEVEVVTMASASTKLYVKR